MCSPSPHLHKMLTLFRKNPDARRIALTKDFHKDLSLFLVFLPRFNGITCIQKLPIPQGHTLHIDASLIGLGGSGPLLLHACHRISQAYIPSTSAAHHLHFKTYLAFLLFMDLPINISVHNILTFLEYPRKKASIYNWDTSSFSHPAIHRFIRSININSKFSPSPRGVFEIQTLYHLSLSCDILSDLLLFREIFLTPFFWFLRMSNIAPHSSSKLDPCFHFLRQDLIFAPPGVHLLIKWTKTLQHHKSHDWIQLPSLSNYFLCPVKALKFLLNSRPLPPTVPPLC